MDNLQNVKKSNFPLITGDKISFETKDLKSLTFEDSLSGFKADVPVSVQIRNFIKEEFSKLKSEI